MSSAVEITLNSDGSDLDGSHIRIPEDPDGGVSAVVIDVAILSPSRVAFRADWQIREAGADPLLSKPPFFASGSTFRNSAPVFWRFRIALTRGDCPVLNKTYKLCIHVLDVALDDPTACDYTIACAEFNRIE
jgi:hypothetical protein